MSQSRQQQRNAVVRPTHQLQDQDDTKSTLEYDPKITPTIKFKLNNYATYSPAFISYVRTRYIKDHDTAVNILNGQIPADGSDH